MNAFDPSDYAVVFGIVVSLLAGLLYLIRGEVIRSQNKIVEQIKKDTAQIQPNANGGRSLNDLHLKVSDLAAQQIIMYVRLNDMTDTVLSIVKDHADKKGVEDNVE